MADRWQLEERFMARMQAKDKTANNFMSVPMRAIGRDKSLPGVASARPRRGLGRPFQQNKFLDRKNITDL